MSRSNGQPTLPGGRQPPRSAADPHGYQAASQHPAQALQQAQWAQAQAAPDPNHYFPPAGEARAADPYAGQYQQPAAPSGYNYQPPVMVPQAPSQGRAPSGIDPAWAPAGSQRGDARNYDLGGYKVGSAPAQPQGYGDLHNQWSPQPQGNFAQPGEHADFGRSAYMAHAHTGHAPQPGSQLPPPPYAGHGHDDGYGDDAHYDDEVVYEDDEPVRKPRRLLLVAILVGAIGSGAGLAYGYKTFMASGPKTQTAKVDATKARLAEVSPPSDRKVMNRLSDEAARAAAAPADAPTDGNEPGSPRRVQTIAVTPSGMAPPPAAPPGTAVSVPVPPVRPASPMVAVPGVSLENVGGPQRVAVAPPPVAPPVAAPPAAPVQKAQPVARPVPADPATLPPARVGATPPPATASAAVAPPPAAPQQKAAVARVTAPSASTGSGYVAVLSSQKTRMDALKAYADLQQRYGAVLGSKAADVQEANLGEAKGGVWYRAVVGPPGSRESASQVCEQLKAAGYTNCWVTGF